MQRLANTLAFDRRRIRSGCVALLAPYFFKYASVARLAGAAHRRSRCVSLFARRYTRRRSERRAGSRQTRFALSCPNPPSGYGEATAIFFRGFPFAFLLDLVFSSSATHRLMAFR